MNVLRKWEPENYPPLERTLRGSAARGRQVESVAHLVTFRFWVLVLLITAKNSC